MITAEQARKMTLTSQTRVKDCVESIGRTIKIAAEDGKKKCDAHFDHETVPHCAEFVTPNAAATKFVDDVTIALMGYGFQVNIYHDSYKARGSGEMLTRTYLTVSW